MQMRRVGVRCMLKKGPNDKENLRFSPLPCKAREAHKDGQGAALLFFEIFNQALPGLPGFAA